MFSALHPSGPDCAAQLLAEQHRREQAEAALAAAQARIADLEQRLADADQQCQRQQHQLTALVQNLRAGLLLVDHEGHIQLVNSYFRELFDLPLEAPLAKGYPPIPPDTVQIDNAFRDPIAFAERVMALHTAGKTVLNEEFVLADGRVVELDYIVMDEEQAGRLICYRDVTELHQRNGQLKVLSFIPKQNPNPIVRLATTGEVLFANPAAAPLMQALAVRPTGEALRQRLLALADTALSIGRQQQELEVGGLHYLLTAVAVPGETYTTLYLTDITARRRAERLLAEQQAFYESILEHVPTAVAVFDAEHRYVYLNSAVEPDPVQRQLLLGKTNEEACLLRQRPATIIKQRERAFAQASHEQQEVVWEEALHGRHWLRRFRPVIDPDGKLRLMIGSGINITERKEVEEKVSQQQEFYESILNLLPVDVAVFDAEHRYLFANPASIADPEIRRQVIGMTNAEYFAFRQRPATLGEEREKRFQQAIRTRTDVLWEETLPQPQGIKRTLRRLRPVYNADGTLQLVVGSGLDITDRYQAEELQRHAQEELVAQQTLIQLIVNTLPNVLYVSEADGSASFTNAAYDRLSERTAYYQSNPEIAAATQLQVQQMRAWDQHVLSINKPLTVELPFMLNSSEVRYFQVHKRPLQRVNGPLGVLTISTDITALKQARQATERRQKQYHDLVHYSQALICTHDLQGKILSVNPAIERLMGAPAARIVGTNLADAILPDYRFQFQDYLNGEIESEHQPSIMAIRTMQGEKRYLHYYTYRVAEDGYPPYVVASGYDMTQAVRAERALQQAKGEAEANARAKESFLARMSHEIRTPLNGVLGMATLLEKTPLLPQQQEYLNTMARAGQHLLSLVNDVLDMAKITASNLQLEHAPFDLAVTLQGAGQTVAALAEQKGLALVVEPLPLAAPRVVGDAYRLHQVVLNLLSNAIKFTEHGCVRLGTDVVHDSPHDVTLRIWVQDTGIGIAPEQQAHIFDAFTQASAETSRRFGGTGLGLAISQQLVHLMGGAIQVCSELGEGTTFSFQITLPRMAEDETDPTAAPAQATYEGLAGLRVLLAEDNLVNQWIAVVMLEHWGVRVRAVGTGTEALDELSTNPYDAAILDIQMPGLNGVEVTTALRQHPDSRRACLPIIALTANAFQADREGYLAAGMNTCLTKPFEEADLCEALLRLTRYAAVPPD